LCEYVARELAVFLFGIKPADPFTVVAVIGALAMVSVGAMLIAALPPTRVNPVEALRYQ
jgi:ABC-type lipoprotein release transport system permease subunit